MAKRGSGDRRERDRRAGKGDGAPGDAPATGAGKPGKVKREQARAARKAEREARRGERETRRIERDFQKMERRLVEAQAILVEVAQRAEALDDRLRSLRGEAAGPAAPAATHEEGGERVPAAEPAAVSDPVPEAGF